MKARRCRRGVIPGFGLSLGVTVTMLSLVVLLPLCSLVIYTLELSPAEFWETVTRPRVLSSFWVSISTSLCAALVNTAMGLLLAWVLVRYDFPGKKIMDGMLELPFALPTAVAGIALTHLTASNGWVGGFFARFGVSIAYTRLGITAALIFVGLPFTARSVQPVLEKLDPQYQEAADMLGAGRGYTFFHVILPELRPALAAGFAMAFARGLGEYGSVVFIAGNTPYKTEIAPLLIMSELQSYDYSAAASIALVMLAVSFLTLLGSAAVQARAARRRGGA